MARTKKAIPQPAASMVRRWIQANHFEDVFRRTEILLRWAEFVGPRIALETAARALDNNVLSVVVSSSSWMQELSYLRSRLITRINTAIGSAAIKDIRFTVGDPSGALVGASALVREQAFRVSTPKDAREIGRQRQRARDAARSELPNVATYPELGEQIARARGAQMARSALDSL